MFWVWRSCRSTRHVFYFDERSVHITSNHSWKMMGMLDVEFRSSSVRFWHIVLTVRAFKLKTNWLCSTTNHWLVQVADRDFERSIRNVSHPTLSPLRQVQVYNFISLGGFYFSHLQTVTAETLSGYEWHTVKVCNQVQELHLNGMTCTFQ